MDFTTLFNQLNEEKWIYYVTRKFNWFVEYVQILATKKEIQEQFLEFSCPTRNYLILNGDEYYSEEEAVNWNRYFDAFWKKDANFFSLFKDKIFHISTKTKDYKKHLQKIDFTLLSNDELGREIKKFNSNYLRSFIPAWTRPDSYLEIKLKEKLKEELKVGEHKANEIFTLIATYPQLGKLDYNEEPLDLLKVSLQIKEGKQNLIEDHMKKYSWLKAPVLYEDIQFTKAEYLERVEEIINHKDIKSEIKRIEGLRKKDEESYKDIISQYGIKGNLLKLCEGVRDFIFLRTFSTEASDHLFFVGRQTVLKEVAQRLDLNSQNVTMLDAKEITSSLNGDKTKEEIRKIIDERLNGFAIVLLNGEVYTFFDEAANKLQEKVSNKYKRSTNSAKMSLKKLSGMPACQGKVKGRVKILLNHRDVNKLERGEVLVASMTTPDYIMAMEKASAFITDEGGITCHAAIIAREFGVPCIVGTGNATKVLKDGDTVEVDAYKGIITILT